jgi:hypothetical protein
VAAFVHETGAKAPEPMTPAVDARDPGPPWVDQETGSRCTIAGRAVSRPRRGRTLRRLPGVIVKWYAWAAGYPETPLGTDQGQRQGESRGASRPSRPEMSGCCES